MKNKLIYPLIFFISFLIQLQAQTPESLKPVSIHQAIDVFEIKSIASHKYLIPADETPKEAQDKRSRQNNVILGKGLPEGKDPLVKNQEDRLYRTKGRTPSIVFEGASVNSSPTDPAGAVGPNHYILVYNTGFRIFDKSGNPLTDQLSANNIFPEEGCCDLTCTYDIRANRFVMTLLGDNGDVYVAVTKNPDPITSEWYVYSFPLNSDYQKLSIWTDGYYLTNNLDPGYSATEEVVFALEREKMLQGDVTAKIVGFPLPGIKTGGFYSPQVFNVSGYNFPNPGNTPIVYLQDDAWDGIVEDHLKIWSIDMDWNNVTNSTISGAQTLLTTPFTSVFDGGSFYNLAQPNGGSLVDALQATIMNQAQFRKFTDHNSVVFNFVVDADNTTDELAAIRWYELRQDTDNAPWYIYQEGTYTSTNEKHAWNGSMGIDVYGNIGMGYTAMGGIYNQYISSYYTGRKLSDPLGVMSIQEQTIALGNGNIPGTRYGDYSKLALDPADDRTFWYSNELYQNGRKDIVGVFKIMADLNYDVGVVAVKNPVNGKLTATESITVSLFNYGLNPVSNIPVSYQIDGGNIITETFTETLNPAEYADFTFVTTADFSLEGHNYLVTAFTSLTTDEDNSNNSFEKQITHVFDNDLGVTAIVSPLSGGNLGQENIIATVKNFGGKVQDQFEVQYILDGGNPVTEWFNTSLNPESTTQITFATPGDFSAITPHTLTVKTLLPNDAVPANDAWDTVIETLQCTQGTNSTSTTIGLDTGTTRSVIHIDKNLVITKVRVTLNIQHTRLADLSIVLQGPNGTFVELSSFNGGDLANYTNTTFDDSASISITDGEAPFTGIFKPENPLSTFNGLSAFGDWTLVINDRRNGEGGTLLNWSLEMCYDENIDINTSDLVVKEPVTNVFEIEWVTDTVDYPLDFSVYNLLGQRVVNYSLQNTNGKYYYYLDLTRAKTGVYIVRLGNKSFAKVRKILVKR